MKKVFVLITILSSIVNTVVCQSMFRSERIGTKKDTVRVQNVLVIDSALRVRNLQNKSGDTTTFKPLAVDASGNVVKGSWAGSGSGGFQTLTYTQNATNNNLAISGGNSQNFLPATTNLAGLLDTARARLIDSIQAGTATSHVHAANYLSGASPDSMYLGGQSNQATTLDLNGFPLKFINIPSAASGDALQMMARKSDSSLVQTDAGFGTWTSTLTGSVNISSASFSRATYTRTGNIITFKISGTVTATVVATESTLRFTFPFTTSNTSQGNIGGGTVFHNTGTSFAPLVTVISSTQGEIAFTSLSIINDSFVITCQYEL